MEGRATTPSSATLTKTYRRQTDIRIEDLSPEFSYELTVAPGTGCALRRARRPGGRTALRLLEGQTSINRNSQIVNRPFRFPDSPTVVAAIQAADIHPSTSGRCAIELLEQPADAVREHANGVRKAHAHAVSAVAGTGPPFITEIHFWTAAPRMMTARTIMTTVQMVSTQPSTLRAALAPTASG